MKKIVGTKLLTSHRTRPFQTSLQSDQSCKSQLEDGPIAILPVKGRQLTAPSSIGPSQSARSLFLLDHHAVAFFTRSAYITGAFCFLFSKNRPFSMSVYLYSRVCFSYIHHLCWRKLEHEIGNGTICLLGAMALLEASSCDQGRVKFIKIALEAQRPREPALSHPRSKANYPNTC